MNPRTIVTFITNAVRQVSLPPRVSECSIPGKNTPIDLVLAIDISGSMAKDDYSPTRLVAAQDAAVDLLAKRVASGVDGKMALVAFNSVGLLACPLTPITQTSKIESSIRSLKAIGGTDCGAGLKLAQFVFDQAKRQTLRKVLLLSDGINERGEDPLMWAARLKTSGVEIQTVGIGGSPQVVDENLLRAVASIDSNGDPMYRFISDRGGLVRHFSEIGGLTR